MECTNGFHHYSFVREKKKENMSQDLAQRRGVRVHALDTSSFLRSCVGIAQENAGMQMSSKVGVVRANQLARFLCEPSETWLPKVARDR